MEDKLMKKNFIWNLIGSGFNAFTSLFFMIMVTRINGVEEAGVFTFAYSTACILYVIGIYSGRVYQINDDSEITDSDYFYTKLLTCIIMVLIGILFCLIKGYNTSKTIIMIGLVVYRAIDAFCEALFAIIQEHNELYKVGKSFLIKAILSLSVFLITDLLTHNIILSIIGINITNLLVMLLYDYRNILKLKFHLEKINITNIKRALIVGFSAFAFVFLTQYVLNAPKYAIDSMLDSKYQTIFGIIIMPTTVITLLGQFIMQPFVIPLKEKLKKDKKEFLKLNLKLIFYLLIFGTIITIGLIIFGNLIFKILYGLNLKKYIFDLFLIMIGAVCYAVTLILSTSLISLKSTFSQFIIYIITSIFALISANILVEKFHIVGASFSYLASMIVLIVLYLIVFTFVYNKYENK